jgi:sigma-54 dependent transcriptional regulator, acetoin dehydrogenase operon transcriptional activator AcoR
VDSRATLNGDPILLGRGDDCEIVLPGREVSRHHARMRRTGPVWILADLGSTNGISINGRRIDEAPLELGDIIRVGEWIGLFGTAEDTAHVQPREISPGLVAGEELSRALAPIRAAAPANLSVVIEGETGTGKECVARALHEWSTRSGPFVAVNCAALPESLAEAELFGYRRGSFTGAVRDSIGYFRAADRGTLFLDEIVELPLALQAKLLRVVEQAEVVGLGETRPTRIDVRLVVAAQRPLRDAVSEGRFRADLHARFEGVSVELVPLRERRGDIPAIFRHVLARVSGGNPPRVDPGLVERLCVYDWPYNVRELLQVTRQLVAIHGGVRELTQAELPARFRAPAAAEPSRPLAEAPRSERRAKHVAALLERLLEALRIHKGNVSKACASLGISRQRAYRVLEKGGVDVDELRFADDEVER